MNARFAGLTRWIPTVHVPVSYSEPICVWDAKTGTEVARFKQTDDGALGLAVSKNGWLVATAGHSMLGQFAGDVINLWDIRSGEHVKMLQAPGRGTYSVAISPDGRMLASGGDFCSGFAAKGRSSSFL